MKYRKGDKVYILRRETACYCESCNRKIETIPLNIPYTIIDIHEDTLTLDNELLISINDVTLAGNRQLLFPFMEE